MKSVFIVTIIGFMLAIASCTGTKSTSSKNKANIPKTSNGVSVLSGTIVKKEFTNKVGVGTGVYEYYLRCSVQDYFIKFCESKVTKAQIEGLNLNEFEGITVEVKIINRGSLDICNNKALGYEQQSRIGNYVVINKIVE